MYEYILKLIQSHFCYASGRSTLDTLDPLHRNYSTRLEATLGSSPALRVTLNYYLSPIFVYKLVIGNEREPVASFFLLFG